MRLLDHFHPPLKGERRWEGFHSAWANSLVDSLNELLPTGYFAEPAVHFGIEIDAAAFAGSVHTTTPRVLREVAAAPYSAVEAEAGVNGQGEFSWQPPQPLHTFPVEPLSASVEVLIYEEKQGPILVGAIELISPANKDRPVQRQAFVSKCETLLLQGVGVIVVDVVTSQRANLHNALMERLNGPASTHCATNLYASAYTLIARHQPAHLELWLEILLVGGELPVLPLWLRGEIYVPVDLARTYTRTCERLRMSGYKAAG